MTVAKQIAARAIELLKKGWCQRAIAKREDGLPVECELPSAVKWCVIGSVRRATYDLKRDFAEKYSVYEQIRAMHPEIRLLTDWNDDPTRTVDEVIKLLEEVS